MFNPDAYLNIEYSPGLVGGPEFSTAIAGMPSGLTQRNVNRWDARRRFRVPYSLQKKTELDALETFFGDRKGRFEGFWFRLPYTTTDIRARFITDWFQPKKDTAANSDLWLEIVEILPTELGLSPGDTPPATFAAFDGSATLSNDFEPGATWGAEYSTTVIEGAVGVSYRFSNRSSGVRHGNISLLPLTLSQVQSLETFFLARKGRAQGFKWTPPGESSPRNVRFDTDFFEAAYNGPSNSHAAVWGNVPLVELAAGELS